MFTRRKKTILPYPHFGWVVIPILLFFGSGFLYEGLPSWRLASELQQSGVITPGVIVEFQDESRNFAIIYRFQAMANDGRLHWFQRTERTSVFFNQKLHDDPVIQVIYDPDNPRRSLIAGNDTFIFQSVLGVLILIWTIVYLFIYIRDVGDAIAGWIRNRQSNQ